MSGGHPCVFEMPPRYACSCERTFESRKNARRSFVEKIKWILTADNDCGIWVLRRNIDLETTLTGLNRTEVDCTQGSIFDATLGFAERCSVGARRSTVRVQHTNRTSRVTAGFVRIFHRSIPNKIRKKYEGRSGELEVAKNRFFMGMLEDGLSWIQNMFHN